jgi:hypothetical protein
VIALDRIHELSIGLHRSTVSDRLSDFSGKYRADDLRIVAEGPFGNSPGGNG